jgi:hypothetical protein
MMRLYLRFYFALVASLFLFVLATATLWHFTGGSAEHSGITLSRLLQNALPAAAAPRIEQQQALQRLTAGLDGAVALSIATGSSSPLSVAPCPAHGHAARCGE